MGTKNQLSAVLDPAAKQAVLESIAQIRQKLSGVLNFNLSPEDRHEMLKMGDKTLAFVEKALDYAGKNPTLVPGYLNLAEANKDLALAEDLRELLHELNTLNQAAEDALMVAGSEAYEAALVFHNSVKGASRSDLGGSQAIYEDLVQRFPGRTTKKTENAAA